jgi:hypothetical protein
MQGGKRMKIAISHPAGLALCRHYLALFRAGANLTITQLQLALIAKQTEGK